MAKPTKFLRFVESETKGRTTKVFHVVNAVHDSGIGSVYWFNPFRKYCFGPHNNTVYDARCLLEIADKLDELNKAHKSAASK